MKIKLAPDYLKEIEEKYTNQLLPYIGCGDRERAHIEADNILCNLLREIGCEKIVAAFLQVEKWYA